MQPRLLRLFAAALAVAGLFAAAPRASADTVTLTLDNNPAGTPNAGGLGNGLNGGGAFYWTETSPLNTSITTYCIDIHDPIRSGTFFTNTVTAAVTIENSQNTNPTATAAAINTLFDHFYSSSFQSATTEAAFQLALWKLIYDGPSNTNFGTGQIQASGVVATEAQDLLKGLSYNGTPYNGLEHDLANATLVALVPDATKPLNQAQITVVPDGPKGVPAPPAVMLAGLGVLALVGRNRWTRRTTAAA